MNREFFNSFLKWTVAGVAEMPTRPCANDFPQKLAGMLIPGPPGAADQAISSMAMGERKAKCAGRYRPRNGACKRG